MTTSVRYRDTALGLLSYHFVSGRRLLGLSGSPAPGSSASSGGPVRGRLSGGPVFPTSGWVRTSWTDLTAWLTILRCHVTTPRRPRLPGSSESTRLTTRIVSPKKTGWKNLHSRMARNARVATRGAVEDKPEPIE